jgi:branched-chain amino acid transport system substrate-binding protein
VTRTDSTQQALTIGFQVPDDDVDSLTGYCVAKMAIDEANAGGSLPGPVDLLPIPDWGNRDQARAAASAFVARADAVAVLGPVNSDMALATQDIYHDAGLAQLTSEASSPLLTSKGFDNFFRLVANDEHQGRSLARAAVTYLGKSRIAVLHDNSGWGRPIAEIFAAEASRLGVPPVLVRGHGEREAALDFNDLVAETLRADVDLVYFAIYWNQAHIITHKLRDAGNQAVFLGSDALKPYAFLEVPSLDPTPPYHTLAGVDIRIKPSARAFFTAFAARYPLLIDAPQYAAEANDCTLLLLEALRRAETTDRVGVLKALRGIRDFTGAIGPIAFDEHGDLVEPEIGLYQCQNGMRRYIGLVNELAPTRGAS